MARRLPSVTAGFRSSNEVKDVWLKERLGLLPLADDTILVSAALSPKGARDRKKERRRLTDKRDRETGRPTATRKKNAWRGRHLRAQKEGLESDTINRKVRQMRKNPGDRLFHRMNSANKNSKYICFGL